jgi:hypothetical protein
MHARQGIPALQDNCLEQFSCGVDGTGPMRLRLPKRNRQVIEPRTRGPVRAVHAPSLPNEPLASRAWNDAPRRDAVESIVCVTDLTEAATPPYEFQNMGCRFYSTSSQHR